MESLANDPNVYGLYFALNNDEFIQVIGVRTEQKIIDSLNAPTQTYFAVRRITQDKNRTEHWQFIDKNGVQLEERTTDASHTPSVRPWFVGAQKKNAQFTTTSYFFSSTGEPGLTISARLPGKIGVLGTDINLRSLSTFLSGLTLTPNAAILMLDGHNQILAFNGRGKNFDALNIPPLTSINAINRPIFKSLNGLDIASEPKILALGPGPSTDFFVIASHLSKEVASTRVKVITMAPMLDFMAPSNKPEKMFCLFPEAS